MVAILLLLLPGLAVSIGTVIVVLALRSGRTKVLPARLEAPVHRPSPASGQGVAYHRPDCWLAIKSRNLRAVQAAFGLHNPRPCSCSEGLAGEKRLFITPPIKGWVLVVGSGVPDPTDDADACFRFVLALSRKLGQVQLFSVSRILHHHGWVRADGGRVQRAYAWAGRTLWNQGPPTRGEKELSLKCYDYAESEQGSTFTLPDGVAANVDKLPLLAAIWSLDPARIDEHILEAACGIAGEPSRQF
jgi:hypothetical protein